MSGANVLITFYSRCGETEKRAAAAAVGAVQAHASIRLRRLPDAGAPESGVAGDDECGEAQLRMQREYVAPARGDVVWADAIIFAAPRQSGARSGEWGGYLDLLRRLGDDGTLDGKLAVVLDAGRFPDAGKSASLSTSLAASILNLGLIVLPPAPGVGSDSDPSAAHLAMVQGRRAAAVAGTLKTGSPGWRDAVRLLAPDHDIR